MNILITGATGFLGRHLVASFTQRYKVFGLSRSSGNQNIGHSAATTDYSVKDLKSHFKGIDAVVHLAARRLNHGYGEDFQENVTIDLNVFQAAYECGITNIVFTSSRGVYGSQPLPWRETSQVAPANLYAVAKAQSELLAQYYNSKGMKIKALRAAQLLGLGEYEESAISTFIKKSAKKEPIELTVQGVKREYLYVKDMVAAIDLALNNPDQNGIFNVGSGEILSLKQIAIKIQKAFGMPHLLKEDIQKTYHEISLMDSSLFRDVFSWQPEYSFEDAMNDIVVELEDPAVANRFGII